MSARGYQDLSLSLQRLVLSLPVESPPDLLLTAELSATDLEYLKTLGYEQINETE